MDTRAVRRALLRWYRRDPRDLPWRRTRDPYAIFLSESMLQQTRVETVIPYYERFLERFPDVQALATADLDDVLELWSGLGYYARARNLHKAAQQMVDQHAGRVPADPEALRDLPGVGRYTAGAVASIAFDKREPVLDGNVMRVLARLLGIREDVRTTAVTKELWEVAGELADGPDPGDLNQALMEFGARICTPRSPRCGECPVVLACRAHKDGDPEAIPVKKKRAAVPEVDAVAALVRRRGRILAVRRPPAGLMGGMWELPGGEIAAKERPAAGLRRALAERVGLTATGAKKAGVVEHLFSHRKLRLHVYRADVDGGRVRRRGFDAHRWVSRAELARLAQGAATRKAIELVL